MQELSLITYENGVEIIYDVIATYHDDLTDKDFIIYTDKKIDEQNNLNLFYSLYKNDNNSIKLLETTNLEDKKIGLELIKEIGLLLSKWLYK